MLLIHVTCLLPSHWSSLKLSSVGASWCKSVQLWCCNRPRPRRSRTRTWSRGCVMHKIKCSEDFYSPALGSRLKVRAETHLEFGFEGNVHMTAISNDFGLKWRRFEMGNYLIKWLACLEGAFRRNEGRQFDHLCLFGMLITLGFIFEGKSGRKGLLEEVAWKRDFKD